MRRLYMMGWFGALLVAPMVHCAGPDGEEGPDSVEPDLSADVDDADGADGAEPADGQEGDGQEVEISVKEGPWARIWAESPIAERGLVEVELSHLEGEGGRMEGAFAHVQSCTPSDERGLRSVLNYGRQEVEVISCVPEQKARPGADGTYLHIEAPSQPAEDDGTFAELMMYHHMQVMHDYFQGRFGIALQSAPLYALTNVSTRIEGCDGWAGIMNAAYVPRLGLDYFVAGLDTSTILGDAIIFSGSSTRNFAFDASVIYHEYTHATVGSTRLQAIFIDAQGINNLPGALNEAYADYFAATVLDNPLVGNYALNDLPYEDFCGVTIEEVVPENHARDLREQKVCPDDLVGEVHIDSEIFSAVLWRMRELLGANRADAIVLHAALELGQRSDFNEAAEMTIQAAGDFLGEAVEAEVRALFEEANLPDCDRVVPLAQLNQASYSHRVEGMSTVMMSPFGDYMPGYLQYGVVVPEETRRLKISWGVFGGSVGQSGSGPDVEMIFKPGTQPVHYRLSEDGGMHDAIYTVALEEGATVIEADEGQFLPAGPWSISVHNKGGRSIFLRGATVHFE